MADRPVRRIVVVCDAACDMQVAVEEAAVLATRWSAALHGVFFEDENLYRLAALPFGREVTLASAVTADLDATKLSELSAAAGAAMRRALADASARLSLDWSFETLRDLPSAAALAAIEGDMLVVEGFARPFSGSWAPPSIWGIAPQDQSRPLLIRRRPQTGSGDIVVLMDPREEGDGILPSALSMAGPTQPIVILVRDGAPADLAFIERKARERMAAATAEPAGRVIKVEAAPADPAALLKRIARLKPDLIAVAAGQGDNHLVRDVLAGTRCDVLLVC